MALDSNIIRIGTRGSPLALAQAHEVRNRLVAAHGLSQNNVSVEVISVAGDRIQDRPLAEVGGKGLFTEDIETRLADGRIDIAVHSSKDMPTELPEGLGLIAFLEREDPRDAFISNKANDLAGLPDGAVVGTSSLRREALIRRLRPDLKIVGFRGNVQTRLRKLDDGVADATLLAHAGLRRLDSQDVITSLLPVEQFLPAPGQGAICIEGLVDDDKINRLVEPLKHADTETALLCERAFLRALDGSCRTPIGGLANIDGDAISFSGIILRPDGSEAHEVQMSGSVLEAEALGKRAAETVRSKASDSFFEGWT